MSSVSTYFKTGCIEKKQEVETKTVCPVRDHLEESSHQKLLSMIIPSEDPLTRNQYLPWLVPGHSHGTIRP